MGGFISSVTDCARSSSDMNIEALNFLFKASNTVSEHYVKKTRYLEKLHPGMRR
jgi:hypothetical protein